MFGAEGWPLRTEANLISGYVTSVPQFSLRKKAKNRGTRARRKKILAGTRDVADRRQEFGICRNVASVAHD